MRIVIGIKKDAFGDVVLNQLYKFTALQTTFGIINLALVNMRPQVLSLKELMLHFLDHRHTVVVRRTEYDLKKAKERAHILEGLRIALDHIDEIVAMIRNSASPDEAHQKLMERFGLSEIQAKAILDMRLQRLTGLERDKIEQEYQDLLKLIDDLTDILANRERRMRIIKDELLELKHRYGDARRTEITDADSDFDIEDLIAEEDMVVTMSHGGYIKRTAVSEYRAQGRGGRGKKGMDSKDDDYITTMFVASTHASLLFFTNTGRCYRMKVYRIPETGRNSKGRPVVNIIELRPGEKIAAIVPVREFDDTRFIIAATERGVINKQRLTKYANINKNGVNAIKLDEGDSLIEVKLASENDGIMIGTVLGWSVRFSVDIIRAMGRNTRGVRGIRLREGDKIVSMIIAIDQNHVLTVTDKGYGKRTAVSEYRKTNRGGKGIINIRLTDKNGSVVALKRLQPDGGQDLMLITKNGIIIRMNIDGIRTIGRHSQGVKLIGLDEGDVVIDVALCDRDEDDVDTDVIIAPVETVPEDDDIPVDEAEEVEDDDVDDDVEEEVEEDAAEEGESVEGN
jgi:DNA gyrase subunit A